jgi:CTP:molybdopterin cytidylyltransferase MocA
VNVAAVVLAAGFSRRLGRLKQRVVVQGATLVERAVKTAQNGGFSPVFVVLPVEFGWTNVDHIVALENPGAEEGIASSIRVGVEAARKAGVDGVVLMTCDQVLVTSEHLRALCIDVNTSAGSGYAGKVGVPAYFPAAMFSQLMELCGDTGARELLRGARVVETEALAFDVDTEEDLRRVEGMLGETFQ